MKSSKQIRSQVNGKSGQEVAKQEFCALHRESNRIDKTPVKQGEYDWRVRQDLNLQPSDPKSEALSN